LHAFEDPGVGIVGCKLVDPNGDLQHTGIYFGLADGIVTAYNRLEEAPSGEVVAVTGACLMVRSDLFRELGGFDEGFRNGYEDVDLCLRARAKGWKVWYCADSVVMHHESQSGPARWTWVRENMQRLQDKWHRGDYDRS
jgi:GT2 family glycosyltransferase